MGKSIYAGPVDRLDIYEELVATVPGLPRKGAANPYTSVNGWMQSFLDKKGKVSIRLGTDDMEEFLETYETERAVQYGSVMKEFAVVPDDLLGTKELAEWFARSHVWAGTLPPK